MYFVYQIYFRTNGKSYIGLTNQPKKRFYNHKKATSNNLIHKAIRKYGIDNIEFNILESNLTKEEAYIKERQYIRDLKTSCVENGYNVTAGGDFGFALFGEKYTKWKTSLKAAMQNPHTRQLLRESKLGDKNPMFGKKVSREQLDKTQATRKLNRVKMIPITMDNNFTFFSVSEASLYCKNDLSGCGNIYNACKGKFKKIYGHTWEFAKPIESEV